MFEDAPLFIRSFLSYKLTIQNRSELTVREYWLDLRTFFRYIVLTHEGKDPDSDVMPDISGYDISLAASVDTADIYSFLLYLAESRRDKPATRARKLAAIRAFYKYHTSKSHELKEDPSKDIDSPAIKRRLPKYLSLEEAEQLLDSVDPASVNAERDECMLTLLLNCGMRLSELTGINLSDISPDLSRLTVTGKGSKQRTIYLNDACRSAVGRYINVRGQAATRHGGTVKDKNALFLSGRYTRISNKTVQWIVKRQLDKCGLGAKGYSVHKLRHTAATLMYDKGGVDVRVLKEILGHEQLNTTQIYTHVSDRQLEEAMDKNPLSKRI